MVLALSLSVQGDESTRSTPALDALVEEIGLDKIEEQLRLQGRENECMIPPVYGEDPQQVLDRCRRYQRHSIALELAGQTFEGIQERVCDGEDPASLSVENCAPSLLQFYQSLDEVYEATCEAYCQSIVPAEAHSKINCGAGIKCQSLMGREDEILAFGQGCFDGVKDGGMTVLNTMADIAATPVDAYAGLVQITNGIMRNGFHDYINQTLVEGEREIGTTVRMAREFPEMMRNQLKVLRCLDSEVARQYMCHFGTVAAAVAAEVVLLRRVRFTEIQEMISSKAFSMLDSSAGTKLSRIGGLSLRNLSTTDQVATAFAQSAMGQKLRSDLSDIEYAIFERALKDVPENPADSKMLSSLVDNLNEENYGQFLNLVKTSVAGASARFVDPAIQLRTKIFPALVSMNSAQLGARIVDYFEIPNSFEKLRERASSVDSYDELPRVDMTQFSEDRSLLTSGVRSGTGYEQLETATRNGQRVCIKTSRATVGEADVRAARNAAEVVNEGRMAVLLHRLEIGPRYHGTTIERNPRTNRDHYVTVTDFVEGKAFTGDEWDLDIPVTQTMIDDVRRAGQRLDAAGIEPNDVQFQLTPDGRAVLIDPEMFEFDTPGKTNAVDEMEAIAQQLEAVRLLQQRQER